MLPFDPVKVQSRSSKGSWEKCHKNYSGSLFLNAPPGTPNANVLDNLHIFVALA